MKLTNVEIREFAQYLYREEKSRATCEKYLRDIKNLCAYADGQDLTKCGF